MYKKCFALLLCLVVALAMLPVPTAFAADPVCEITGGASYETLDAAIAAVPGDTPTTIRLLQTIDRAATLRIDSARKITLDLNGFNLNINAASGAGLEACFGGSIATTGEGALNASGVMNGVFAHDGGSIDIAGSATGTGNTGNHENGAGADADSGCSVTVRGNAAGDMRGVGAFGGSVRITGSVTAHNLAAYANQGGSVTIGGDVTGTSIGVYAHAATVHVAGNIRVTGADSTGLFAYGGSAVTVAGSIEAVRQGISASDASHVTVNGGVTTTDLANGFAALAEKSAVVHIGGSAAGGPYGIVGQTGGDISVDGDVYGHYCGANVSQGAAAAIGGNLGADGTVGVGVNAYQGSSATVGGSIQAHKAMTFGESDGSLVTPTTKSGYRTYSDGADPASFVWVRLPPPPTVSTGAATDIATAGAAVSGTASGDAVGERGFVYSADPNPAIGGAGVLQVAAGSGSGAFSAALAGLAPCTAYHVRAYAVNEGGTAYGEDRAFTTLAEPITGLPGSKTLYTGGRLTLKPSPKGGQWAWDKDYVTLTVASDGSAVAQAKKAGSTVLTYTRDGRSAEVMLTIRASELPGVGQESRLFLLMAGLSVAAAAGALALRGRKTQKT